MARASKLCNHCPNLQPCPDHPKVPWAGSTRSERTASGWEQQRQARLVMHTHDGICHVCHQPGADQVDHVIPTAPPWNGPDTLDNKRPIHKRPCHERKTQREATEARTGGGRTPLAPASGTGEDCRSRYVRDHKT